MFFDDSLKELKKELKSLGANVSFIHEWQKVFDKVKKQSSRIEGQYIQVKMDLEAVYGILQGLEKLLISSRDGLTNPGVRKNVLEFAKELKKYQNAFNHEFLISKEDSDFQSTYVSILSLANKDLKEKKGVLILQSEVENLLALTKEALEKEWPSFRAMAYFYLNHDDKEIFDLPHMEKVEKVKTIYEEEFFKPMYEELIKYMDDARVRQILEVEVWN